MNVIRLQKGFTVIEVLIVISIIGILLSFVVPMGGRAKTKAREARARAEIAALETAISAYYTDMGTYPTDNPGAQNETSNAVVIKHLSGRDYTQAGYPYVNAIINDANWNGPYMEFDANNISGGGAFVDPWSNAYIIQIDLDGDVSTTPPTNNALSYDIASNGKDGAAGGGDDITNY